MEINNSQELEKSNEKSPFGLGAEAGSEGEVRQDRQPTPVSVNVTNSTASPVTIIINPGNPLRENPEKPVIAQFGGSTGGSGNPGNPGNPRKP